MPNWLLLMLVLATGQGSAPTVSSDSGSAESQRIQFRFEKEPWDKVLETVSKPLGLTLRMDDPPPGRFTYFDKQEYTPERAFEIIHGVLLDRGVTLVRQQSLLLVVRLADNVHGNLVPFVPVAELDKRDTSEFILAVLPLNQFDAKLAADELDFLLSPRGKLFGTTAAKRLVAMDRAGAIRQMRDLLAELDPPGGGKLAQLAVVELRNASAVYASRVVRDALGIDEKQAAKTSNGPNFTQMAADLGNRQVLESFTPGISLKGMVADAPRDDLPPRIVAYPSENKVLVAGEANIVEQARRILEKLDLDEDPATASVRWKTFTLASPIAAELARQLEKTFPQDKGYRFSGNGRALFVGGTPEQLREVEQVLDRTVNEKVQLAVFPVVGQDVEVVKEQLDKLFKGAAKSAPTIVADAADDRILVRGTAGQIAQIKLIVDGLSRASLGDELESWRRLERLEKQKKMTPKPAPPKNS